MIVFLLICSVAAYVTVMIGMGILGKKTFRNTTDRMYFQVVRNLLSFAMMALIGRSFAASRLTLLLAAAMGASTLLSSVSSLAAYRLGPVSISVLIISSLSMLISSLAGPLFWGEAISIGQIAGMILCVISMALLTERSLVRKTSFSWIIALICGGLGGGLQGPLQKVLSTSPYAGEKTQFVIYTFAFSFVASVITLRLVRRSSEKETVTYRIRGSVLWLFLSQAALSVFLNINNLKLVAELPTIIFFPSYSIGGLLLTSLASCFLFKEKLSKRQTVGFAAGLFALVLISGILG